MARLSDDRTNNKNSNRNEWQFTEGKAWHNVTVGSRHDHARGNYRVRCARYYDPKSDEDIKEMFSDFAAESAGFS